MQTRKILVVVAVALLLGTVSAMAQSNRDEFAKVQLPRAGAGEMYSRTGLISQAESTPSMPTPVEPMEGPVESTFKTDSAFTMDGSMGFGQGSALMTPRGGAISSPKQLADREIKRLIRRLD